MENKKHRYGYKYFILRKSDKFKYFCINGFEFKFGIFLNLMEPKKDVSTAILDQKKAPNKLLVLFV